MSYAQICLKLQSRRKKLVNLDNKTRFGYLNEHCLGEWVFQYVVLKPKPIHNSRFSIYPGRKSNAFSFGYALREAEGYYDNYYNLLETALSLVAFRDLCR